MSADASDTADLADALLRFLDAHPEVRGARGVQRGSPGSGERDPDTPQQERHAHERLARGRT